MESKNVLQAFTGRLDNVQLLDVIQMACLAQKDGCLSIKDTASNSRRPRAFSQSLLKGRRWMRPPRNAVIDNSSFPLLIR